MFNYLCILFCVSGFVMANDASDSVWDAYYHRQYDKVKIYTEKHDDVNSHILRVILKIMNKEDDAEASLEKLLKQYADVALVQHKAVDMWRAIGKQSSIFSRMKYYERSVTAQIRAAELEPTNARYRKDLARAKGFNGSLFSADLKSQRAVIDTMKESDPRYLLMAEMDYAQNLQDKKKALSLIDDARLHFASDIEVLERAAQLLWTNDEVILAQQVFAQVCQLPPGKDYIWEPWLQSCEISAMLAQKEEAPLDIGLASSQRIVDLDTVHDDYYADGLLVHAELLYMSGKREDAISSLKKMEKLPASNDTRKQANRWLKKWQR